MDRDRSPQDKCGLEAHVDIEDLKHLPGWARDALHEFDHYARAAAIVMQPPSMAELMIRRSIEASIYAYGAVFTRQENTRLKEELALRESQQVSADLRTQRAQRTLMRRPTTGLARHRVRRA